MINKQAVNQSKPHFDSLDGLRGLAAIAIVIFHLYEFIIPDYTKSPIGHGFLAVDFFFCLSGFVMGYAYDDRAKQIGFCQFSKNRLIRLHPLVILGSVLGLLGYLFDPFAVSRMPAEHIAGAFATSLFLLPYPHFADRGFAVFPLNSPAWSLLMEYLINIFYILILVRVSKRWLIALLIFSFAMLAFTAKTRGWIITGWDGPTFFDGFARVGYSFLAGLAVFRFGWYRNIRVSFWLFAVALIAVLFIPHRQNDWIVELAIVTVLFPLIISLCAGVKIHGFTRKFSVYLGRLSYPLYMTHIWMVSCFGNYLATRKPSPAETYLAAFGVFCAAIILAHVAMTFYDELLRNWLKKRARKPASTVA